MGVGLRENPGDIQKGIKAVGTKEFLLASNGNFSLLSLDWKPRRKYHTFLAKSLHPPAKRFITLSAIKEYAGNSEIHPERFVYPNTFITESPPVVRRVFLGNGVRIVYLGNLEIRPFFNYRHMYDVRNNPGNAEYNLDGNVLEVRIDGNPIRVKLSGRYKFTDEPRWERFEYEIDRERYEDWVDYNFSPGRIQIMGNLEISLGEANRAKQEFLVNTDRGKLVIAGYPWFSFWTRDALVFTRYLITAGKLEKARETLVSIYKMRQNDILPEYIDDRSGIPVYTGLDGNLMFIPVLQEYVEYSGDRDILRIIDPEALLMPAIGKLDADLFLDTNSWMDTIHREKPVEIQGFLFSSLLATSRLIESDNSTRYETLASRLRNSFRENYIENGVILDSMNDRRFRPNFLFLAYFRDKIISPREMKESMKLALENLVTEYGLRSLSPDEPGYYGRYDKSKPDSYHNGTVWSWLIGPFYEAVNYAYPKGKQALEDMVSSLEGHRWSEGVIGQVSEIFDGNPPHRPRGCPAQAWSLAELERVKRLIGHSF